MSKQEQIEFVFDDAKDTIIGRGVERDQPDGERTIPHCVTAFNAVTGHTLSNTDGWLFMQILKMCRSVQGAYKYDDYRDGVGYAALRAEEARMENETDPNKRTHTDSLSTLDRTHPSVFAPGAAGRRDVLRHGNDTRCPCGDSHAYGDVCNE